MRLHCPVKYDCDEVWIFCSVTDDEIFDENRKMKDLPRLSLIKVHWIHHNVSGGDLQILYLALRKVVAKTEFVFGFVSKLFDFTYTSVCHSSLE